MIKVIVRKTLFDDLSRGYVIEMVEFEKEDVYCYTVASDNDAIFCYYSDDDEMRLEIYKDGAYTTIYKGKILDEEEYEWLKKSLERHKEVKKKREILMKEWSGIEVLNA